MLGGNVSANYYSGNGGGLTNISSSSHNHDGSYASSSHNHDSSYASASHTHSGYASSTHNHDGTYASSSHTHTFASLSSRPGFGIGSVDVSYVNEQVGALVWAPVFHFDGTYNIYLELSFNGSPFSKVVLWNNKTFGNYFTYSDGFAYFGWEDGSASGYVKAWIYRRTGRIVYTMTYFL